MRSDAVEKRAALLDAAWRLFADKGSDVPLRAVAADAGVGIATLYRHFPTREDLIIGVVGEMVERVLGIIARHRDGWGTPEEAERTWHSLAHEIAELKLGTVAERTVAIAPQDGVVWKATEHLRTRLTEGYRGVLERASSHGLVDADLPPWRFQLGLAAISRPLPERVEYFASGQTEWLVDVYLEGLRPR